MLCEARRLTLSLSLARTRAHTHRSVVGGSAYSLNTKGMVANVKFSSSLMTKLSLVKTVVLSNLNLQPQADNISLLLPPNVADLTLDNGLFTAFPKGLSTFKSLSTL